MNADTILQRSAARDAARIVAELVIAEAAGMPAAGQAAYWEELRKLLPREVVAPPVATPPATAVEPFTDEQARHWGRTRIPFGKHEGTPIDEIPLDYLEHLAEPTEFIRHLRRYLASGRVRQEEPDPIF